MLIAAVVVHNSQVIESEEEAVKEQGPYA